MILVIERKWTFLQVILFTCIIHQIDAKNKPVNNNNNNNNNNNINDITSNNNFTKNSTINIEAKVVNGQTANHGSYPFFALLNYKYIDPETGIIDPEDNNGCGGALIGHDLVLSAAHCCDDMSNYQWGSIHLNRYDISDGTNYPIGNPDDEYESYEVEQHVVHPNYNAKGNGFLGYDICLIKLKGSSDLPVLFVPDKNVLPTLDSSSELTVIGYGASTDTTYIDDEYFYDDMYPEQLQQSTLYFVSTKQCRSIFADYNAEKLLRGTSNAYRIRNGVLCAQRRGSDVCYGDSGGPILFDLASRSHNVPSERDTLWAQDIINNNGTFVHPQNSNSNFSNYNENFMGVGLAVTGIACDGKYPGLYASYSFNFSWIRSMACTLSDHNQALQFDCSEYPVRTPAPTPAPTPTPPPTPSPTTKPLMRSVSTIFASDHSQAGSMFDILGLVQFRIHSLSIHTSVLNEVVEVEVYNKTGSYVSAARDPTRWNVVGVFTANGRGEGQVTPLPAFKQPIAVQMNSVMAFYLTLRTEHLLMTSWQVIGDVFVHNDFMKVYVGASSWYLFGRSNMGQIWNGEIVYYLPPSSS